MSLPPAAPRSLAHTRKTTFCGYRRDDGLWDIEAELHDSKPIALELTAQRTLAPGEAIHWMRIRVTVDAQLTVRDIASEMARYPHAPCIEADQHMRRLIGCTMARGWRKQIETHLGGVQGCTHLRELLFNMATAAFQTLAPQMLASYKDQPNAQLPPPPHLGGCMTWDFAGPTVRAVYPLYYRPRTEAEPEQEPKPD